MSDNISKMNDKQLRNEVQLLRDELAIMKRKFEDIIYNLDTDNFSSRFVKEQGDMKTEIKVTAEGIKTKVSKTDLDDSLSNYSTIEQTDDKIESTVVSINNSTEEKLKNYSTISQTAEKIESAVTSVNNSTDAKLKNYSTITQTDEKITSKVTREYINDKISGEYATNEKLKEYSTTSQTAEKIDLAVKSATETLIEQTDQKISASVTETKEYAEGYVTDVISNGGYVTNTTFKTQFDIYADGIYSEVSGIYETKEDADSSYSSLQGSISSISQTADRISSRVSNVEKGEFGGYTLFSQDYDKFTFEGNVEIKSTDNSSNTLKLSDGSIQLIPYSYSDSVVELRMHYINNNWEPRMKFGRGTGDGTTGIGWIYKNTNGFGMMYNNGTAIPPTIEFQDDGIYIVGNVNFSGGTVTGLPVDGSGGNAVAKFG